MLIYKSKNINKMELRKRVDRNTGKETVRVSRDNKKSHKRDSSKLDVYEFTYDPEEEPPPTKKKKKKPVAKKHCGGCKITIKKNYDKNLAKALAALKSSVSSKTCTKQSGQEKITNVKCNTHLNNNKDITKESNTNKNVHIVVERNNNSVRVEDIAKDLQAVEDEYNIDYSPVNSPCHPLNSAEPSDNNHNLDRANVDDPLNLRDDVSFFDELPAANSSMNVSQRHPLASPWRVEFESLPIKWQVNAYVKPNMTPAVESSFISFSDKKKKHVYTNMVPEANESLLQVVQSTPKLKQTSIISFIKEVVEKSANKKRKVKSTPVKANSLFEDITNTSILESAQKKQPSNNSLKENNLTPIKDISHSRSNHSSNISNNTENSDIHQNIDEISTTPKVQKNKTDKNLTFFGFDESEDQENISPKKIKNKAKSLRSRSRRILQELNVQKGPTRANIPVAVKSTLIQSSDVVNKLFDGVRAATEPPVFLEPADKCNTVVAESTKTTNTAESISPENVENEDSESVHLFEDIEFVHHHKPSRKSYGKSKKVAFSSSTAADNDSSSDIDQVLSDEDLGDLSFKLPSVKSQKTNKKKKTNKRKLSKKEEKEVEAWAANFNSMCEDIDEFDLVVE